MQMSSRLSRQTPYFFKSRLCTTVLSLGMMSSSIKSCWYPCCLTISTDVYRMCAHVVHGLPTRQELRCPHCSPWGSFWIPVGFPGCFEVFLGFSWAAFCALFRLVRRSSPWAKFLLPGLRTGWRLSELAGWPQAGRFVCDRMSFKGCPRSVPRRVHLIVCP